MGPTHDPRVTDDRDVTILSGGIHFPDVITDYRREVRMKSYPGINDNPGACRLIIIPTPRQSDSFRLIAPLPGSILYHASQRGISLRQRKCIGQV
jgi:hypothetical protein